MLEPLNIEFQITLRDWLEFKRKEQSTIRLWLLKVADTSWFPLSLLLLATVIVLTLSLSRIITIRFPAWPAFALLVLLASCRVYLSVPSISSTRLAKKEWKETLANESCTLELTETGFQYVDGSAIYDAQWTEASLFQSENLIIVCHVDTDYALIIPKRAFVEEKQLETFLDIAYQKTVLDRKL